MKVSEEIGKATHRARLHMENRHLKSQISKISANLGSELYNKIVKEGKKTFIPSQKVKYLLDELSELEKTLDTNQELLMKEEKK